MFKKLGKLYRQFLISIRKTGDIKIEQDLQSARNIENGINSKPFIDYINKNFPATTDEERKQKAEVLKQINNNT